ncbi:MAG: hypothetical protein P8J37_15035 [Fuerstiella sp.]|nr:hypothetical protein [Fuerstiella sp.]
MSRVITCLLLLSLLSASGCALIDTERNGSISTGKPVSADQLAEFQNDAPVRTILRLNTSNVTTLATDQRIRSGLGIWEELDESGLMSPEDRRRLNQSGLRVGVAGSTLPWALTSLLRGERVQSTPSSNDRAEARRKPDGSIVFGTQLVLPSGSTSLIEIPSPGDSLLIPAGHIAGLKHGAELRNARCMFHVSTAEIGDGWVVIRFLPQIHHGEMSVRYSIADSGEQLPVRQRIQPLYEQQFELKLHTGETAVIGYQKQDDWTVGRLMFQRESLSSLNEQVVTIELAAVEAVQGQKSVTVKYSNY